MMSAMAMATVKFGSASYAPTTATCRISDATRRRIHLQSGIGGCCWPTVAIRGGRARSCCRCTTLGSNPPDFDVSQRSSLIEVRKEIQRCYELVHKLGRGVIYLGSSRVKTDHSHYTKTVELAREVAKLLDCTTWTGAGPGLMDAAFQGAFEANKPVGGFKIARESGEWTSSNYHPYLPPEAYLTCRFFSARKHGLVDAAVRNDLSDMTAVVALPGGIGTLDEVFEILLLIQLERIGSKHPVPFLLMNYDSYYSKLLSFIDECEIWGTVARGEVASLWKVCGGNLEALEYLAEFYNLPESRRDYDVRVDVEQSNNLG